MPMYADRLIFFRRVLYTRVPDGSKNAIAARADDFFNTGLNHFLRMHPDPMAWGRGDGKGRKEENEKEIGGFLSRKRDLKE